MAKAGKAGKVTVVSDDMGGSSTWTFNPGTRIIDVTAHGDTYEESLVLFINSTGTITAFYDETDAAQDALINAWEGSTTAVIKLYLDGTYFWQVTAIIETMSFSAAVSGAVTVTFSFRSTGAITKPA